MTAGARAGRRLWLVRHGETEGQSSIRFHGKNDVVLSDVGRTQIRALAPLLAGVDFARVLHSPLLRAAESARLLAHACGLSADHLVADERLREISFGACEGMTGDEIAAAFPEFWRAYQAGTHDTFPGGEPRADFVARVRAAAADLIADAWHGDVLVVAHRGTVRQMLRALLAVQAADADAFGVALGSVSVVRDAGTWQLDALGLVP